jgi:hypothetical protein
MGGQALARRSLVITGVVVTAANVRELARRLAQQQLASAPERSSGRLSFRLTATDGTLVDFDEVGHLDEGGVLDTRRIVAVEVAYENRATVKFLSIRLRHGGGEGRSDNCVRIFGKDETWVNGSIRWIQDCVSNWEKQATWPRKRGALIWIGLWVLSSAMVVKLLASVWGTLGRSLELLELLYCIFLLLTMASSGVAAALAGWVTTLYPHVELAMGPAHLQIEKVRRERLHRVVVIVVAPLLLGMLAEVLSRWLL